MLIIRLNLVPQQKFSDFFFFLVALSFLPLIINVDNLLKFPLDRGPAALDRIWFNISSAPYQMTITYT